MQRRRTDALRGLAPAPRTLARAPSTLARVPRTLAIALIAGASLGGCATVDLGDNFVAPDLQLDEDYFYCVIEPQVIQAGSCATGGAGEAGSCHSARSAMRLSDATTVAPPACEDDRPTTPVPPEYVLDFMAVQLAVQSDPLSSPLYRRPTGLDSHPRVIFPEGSPEAELIADWISRGGL